ncbi:RNA polymerase sigma factor [Actinomadura rubrisoli]|uniref:Sigma-70 family RNA polymerase sigma factor n=1 Tax=Actinomadura rubrisoli TaxID=2530368 RepID=A0A4R5AZH5_9ACTN|nr:sigma-70 family RNA polymerase sigma factor [Actinomadura rubrisoli]TDD79018.1 hypothetical protein E1298_28795 [Actinomadura rubrisoli]
MDDHLLVEALRERDPGAPAALYGAYADRLYAYCWFQLRGRDAAQVALRDTFIVAEAHIGKLRDPDRFGPWLYAIARLECTRRLPPRGQSPDLPIASHDQEDVDQRITAWQAVLALRPVTREILELRVRHQLSVPDLAAIFDLPVREAQAALDRAHGELEEALTAEVLASQGPYGCSARAVLLRERRGELTSDLSGRLVEHAQECETCGAFRPRTVSAAKVYGLLPDAVPPDELRLRVMSCFLDPDLVGYRLFVATRVTEFTPNGFPAQSKQSTRPLLASCAGGGLSWLRRFRRTRGDAEAEGGTRAQAVRVAAVLAVTALLFGGGLAAMYGFFGVDGSGAGPAGTLNGPLPTAVPGLPQSPVQDHPPAGLPDESGSIDPVPVSATFPLGSQASSAPPIALPSPSSDPVLPNVSGGQASVPVGTLAVSPLFLDLAGGSDGTVELRAEGKPVAWRAKGWGSARPSQSSGYLEAGRAVSIGVHVERNARSRGEGGITFQPGGVQVHVTWRPDEPDPGPDPTPTPTGPTDPSTPPASERPETRPPSSQPKPPSSSAPPPSDPPAPSDPPPASGGAEPPPSSETPNSPGTSGESPTPQGSA